MSQANSKPVVVRPRRTAPVFVCRKCLKRSDAGKTINKAIKQAIKSETKCSTGSGLKPARMIATSCFGLCPKHAVVVTGGACAGDGAYLLIAAPDEVPAALARLREDGTTRSGVNLDPHDRTIPAPSKRPIASS